MDGLGRFADPSILILTSLAGGPKHGYTLIKDIGEPAGATLGPGTLYAALARLESRKLIRALPEQDRRRPCEITADGAGALRVYLEHARRVAGAGLRRMVAHA